MTRVLCDANALMMPVELGVRVFDELDRLLGGPGDPTSARAPGAPGAPLGAPRRAERSEEARAKAAGGVGIEAASGEESVDSGIDGVTLLVPKAVVRELEALSGTHGEEAIAASVGTDLATERCRILPHEESHADDAVLEIATDPRAVIDYVLTNDRALRERLEARDLPVICLRGHDQLTITNP